jgi:hypothetical protein
MIKKFYKKLTFLQGVALTICLTSIISIAATNLPGFFVFSPGTPISSSEVNANFEKLTGLVVVKATMSTAMSLTNANFGTYPDCLTCTMYRSKLLLNTVTTTDGNFLTATDTDPNTSSNGAIFSYYQVPASGWYEIRLIPSISSTMSTPTITGSSVSNCSHSINSYVNIIVAASASSVGQYSGGMYNGFNLSDNDTNCDGIPETTYINDNPPEIKKIYLKIGQVLYLKMETNYYESGETANYSTIIPANALDLTIIKL